MSSSPSQRYEVIERLDAGGMAEVFRGIATSLEGFEKLVAIKRVLPHLAKNEKFVQMFLDEARLSLYLGHANIVSVFDLGQSGETYFIVMEFIDGMNLKKLIESAREQSGPIPTALAVYIAIEMCKGLDYAHSKKDRHGNILNIVHRDISPPNVLLSRNGEVKLTDFGLAKATSQVEQTDPGVVKGKFGYLSPEAAHGEEVDALTDIYACGIVLWEMLAGRRLFQGNTDFETLELVRASKIPSLHDINPNVDPELERIVNEALAKNKRDRFQTARELGRRLSGYLVGAREAVTAYDLAAFMESFSGKKTIEQDKSRNSVLTAAIQDEINRLNTIATTDDDISRVGNFEDPRTWSDWGFDADELVEQMPPPKSVASTHASGAGRREEAVVPATVTRVRTSTQRPSPANAPHTPTPSRPERPNPSPTGPQEPRKMVEAATADKTRAAATERASEPPQLAEPASPAQTEESADVGKYVFYALGVAVVIIAIYLVTLFV